MPRQQFLSEQPSFQDSRQVVQDNSDTLLINAAGFAAKEANKAIQSSRLQSEARDVQRQTEASFENLLTKETQLGEQTIALNQTNDQIDQAEVKAVFDLKEQIANAKRGQDAGVLTPSAAEARIKAKTREFSNRFPAFSRSLSRTGEAALAGFSSSQLVQAFESQVDIQSKVDAQTAKSMGEKGFDFNNSAHRATWERQVREIQALEFIKKRNDLQASLSSNQYLGQLNEDTTVNTRRILTEFGAGNGKPIEDVVGLQSAMDTYFANAAQEARLLGREKNLSNDSVNQAVQEISDYQDDLNAVIKSGNIDTFMSDIVSKQELLADVANWSDMKTTMRMQRAGILAPYYSLAGQISSLTENQRDAFFDMNPAIKQQFDVAQGVEGSTSFPEVVSDFLGQAAQGLSDSKDPMHVAMSRLILGQPTSLRTPEDPSKAKEIEKTSMLSVLNSDNSYDIKLTNTPKGRVLAKQMPKEYNVKLNQATQQVFNELEPLDIPEGARIEVDPVSGAVAIVGPGDKLIGVSSQPPTGRRGAATAQRDAYNAFVEQFEKPKAGKVDRRGRRISSGETTVPTDTMNLLSYITNSQRNLQSIVTGLQGQELFDFLLAKPQQQAQDAQ